jgi:hypothetical protein
MLHTLHAPFHTVELTLGLHLMLHKVNAVHVKLLVRDIYDDANLELSRAAPPLATMTPLLLQHHSNSI